MKEIHKFECELCGKEFDTIEQANAHEEYCSIKNIPVKAIVLNIFNKIMIIEYPKAKYWKDKHLVRCKVNLMPTSKYDECNYFYPALQFRFETIKKINNGDLVIYTTNFDKEYEKKCISNLINLRIKELKNKRVDIEKEMAECKEKYDNMDNIEINSMKDMLVEELDI